MSHVKHLTNLQELYPLLKSDKLTIIDFSANWCNPCKMIAPIFEKLSMEYLGANFVHIDIDVFEDKKFISTISSLPTFQFYQNGEMLKMFSGANKNKLIDTIFNILL